MLIRSFRPEAAIVNYYQLGATLSGHIDHSEDDLTAPLISIRYVYLCLSVHVCASVSVYAPTHVT